MRAERKNDQQQIAAQLWCLFDVYKQALIKAMKFYLRKKNRSGVTKCYYPHFAKPVPLATTFKRH